MFSSGTGVAPGFGTVPGLVPGGVAPGSVIPGGVAPGGIGTGGMSSGYSNQHR